MGNSLKYSSEIFPKSAFSESPCKSIGIFGHKHKFSGSKISNIFKYNLPSRLKLYNEPSQLGSFLHKRKKVFLFLLLASFIVSLRSSKPLSFSEKTTVSGKDNIALTFDVCGGLTNQILSISFAATVAVHLKAKYFILPALNSRGIQRNGEAVHHDSSSFNDLFDQPHFSSTMSEKFGISVVSRLPPQNYISHITGMKQVKCLRRESVEKCIEKVNRNTWRRKVMMHMECPFLSNMWDSNFLLRNEGAFSSIISSLQANDKHTDIAKSIYEAILQRSGSECINVLHVRIENDWDFHCSDYASNLQISFFDCFVLPAQIFSYAGEVDFFQCSIYLAYDSRSMSEELLDQLNNERMKLDVKTFTFDDFSSIFPNLGREARASIDQYISMKYAEKFMGNSISTFSALIIRNRRLEGKWASHYNRGEIPLARFVPGYRLPWIFAVRGADRAYDYMMHAALRSAKLNTTLIPYCMIHPSEENYERTSFLRKEGVNVIVHKPEWEDELLKILETTSPAEKAKSHLYKFPKAVLGTYARLDIPKLSQLLQYEHYLYTDTDIYFRKDISPLWKELILPSEIKMGYEDATNFPMNAGVIIASLPFMRKTYNGLLKLVLSKNSIDHGPFGPGDQGALNEYYRSSLNYSKFWDDMNVKPYKSWRETARIVHFHGPKPHDYLEYMQNGHCRFNKMCSRGLNNAVCSIFSEWTPLTYGFTSIFREREHEIAKYCKKHAKIGHFYLDKFEKAIKNSICKKIVNC